MTTILFQTFGLQNYEKQQFICNFLQQSQGTNVNSLASTRYDQGSFFTINPQKDFPEVFCHL